MAPMGNHEITCEFCKQDQRSVSFPCCEQYEAKRRSEQAAREATLRLREATLERHGIYHWRDGQGDLRVDVAEVVRVLEKVEAEKGR